MTIYNK